MFQPVPRVSFFDCKNLFEKMRYSITPISFEIRMNYFVNTFSTYSTSYFIFYISKFTLHFHAALSKFNVVIFYNFIIDSRLIFFHPSFLQLILTSVFACLFQSHSVRTTTVPPQTVVPFAIDFATISLIYLCFLPPLCWAIWSFVFSFKLKPIPDIFLMLFYIFYGNFCYLAISIRFSSIHSFLSISIVFLLQLFKYHHW